MLHICNSLHLVWTTGDKWYIVGSVKDVLWSSAKQALCYVWHGKLSTFLAMHFLVLQVCLYFTKTPDICWIVCACVDIDRRTEIPSHIVFFQCHRQLKWHKCLSKEYWESIVVHKCTSSLTDKGLQKACTLLIPQYMISNACTVILQHLGKCTVIVQDIADIAWHLLSTFWLPISGEASVSE